MWPIISYGCEAWTMTLSPQKKSLQIFERKILRRIFGPVYENGLGWKVGHNEQLRELADAPDIAKYVSSKNYNVPIT
jgi:hypothetical protein